MPKSKKKNDAPKPLETFQARVPASERREEEFSFNQYSRRSVKVTTVTEAVEEIKNIKNIKRRRRT